MQRTRRVAQLTKISYITRVNISSNAAQAKQIKSMARAFSNLDVDFELISPGDSNFHVNFRWTPLKLNFGRWLMYLSIFRRSIIKVVLQKRVVITRDIAIATIVALVGGRVIYEAHKEPKRVLVFKLFSYLSKKDNVKIISISQALSNYYIKHFQFQESKLLTAHDGVALEDFDALRSLTKAEIRAELNIPLDRVVMTHTGSLYKGDDAKLFRYVVKNFPNILFIQVGGSDVDIEKYSQYYSEFRNIVFIPHQNDEVVVKYQLSADMLFYALTKENNLHWCTSPLKVFEYMAAGVPILASNIGSVSEILNKSNSVTYVPDKPDTIREGVNYLLKNKKVVKRRACKALDDVRNKYTWSLRAKNILEFIERYPL